MSSPTANPPRRHSRHWIWHHHIRQHWLTASRTRRHSRRPAAARSTSSPPPETQRWEAKPARQSFNKLVVSMCDRKHTASRHSSGWSKCIITGPNYFFKHLFSWPHSKAVLYTTVLRINIPDLANVLRDPIEGEAGLVRHNMEVLTDSLTGDQTKIMTFCWGIWISLVSVSSRGSTSQFLNSKFRVFLRMSA